MNASNLKNPEQYDEFVLALQKILIRFAIKMDSCLVAEEDGHIFSSYLQHQTVSMLNNLQNGADQAFPFYKYHQVVQVF